MSKKGTPEQEIQKAILEYLGYQKGVFWRVNSGAMAWGNNRRMFFVRDSAGRPFAGFSDIVGIWLSPEGAGKFVAIEVKALGKKPSPQQQIFLDAVKYWGGIGIVAYSVDDVRNVICN